MTDPHDPSDHVQPSADDPASAEPTEPMRPDPYPQGWTDEGAPSSGQAPGVGPSGAGDHPGSSGYPDSPGYPGYSDYSGYSDYWQYWGYPGYPGYPGHTVYGHAASGSPRRPAPPAWMWLVVVAVTLVIGLVAGVLGGSLVLAARGGSSTTVPSVSATPAPLPSGNNDIAQVAAKLLPSTVQVIADIPGPKAATGSGFVLDGDGHVITNNHVVADAADGGKISVIDYRGVSHKATIVGRSEVYDVAVLEVRGIASLPPAALGSSKSLQVGQPVVAIGSPLGLSSTVTSGIVSALGRPVTAGPAKSASFFSAVQTDAAINPGNSGGPLVNLQGQVIGVNSAIATVSSSATEAGSIGVGFAIPIEQVKRTAEQILATGQARYPVIGASVNIGSKGGGAYVEEVPSGTPADRAGIKAGDVIVAIDGLPVRDGVELIVDIRDHMPGDTVTLSVRHRGTVRKVELTLDGKAG